MRINKDSLCKSRLVPCVQSSHVENVALLSLKEPKNDKNVVGRTHCTEIV